MTGALANDDDSSRATAAAQDGAHTAYSPDDLGPRVTEAEDLDSTIIADTTLTHDLSQHGLDVTHLKRGSIASSSHSLTATHTQPEPSDDHTNNTIPRGARQPSSPNKEAQPDSDFDGANLTQDVTFVAEPHDLEGEWRKEGREYAKNDKDNAEANEDLPNESELPSSSSPIRSHSRPGELQLNVKPPSPQPWDLAIPTDFDPTKTTGLSIPASARGYSPVGSQKFSTMQTAVG